MTTCASDERERIAWFSCTAVCILINLPSHLHWQTSRVMNLPFYLYKPCNRASSSAFLPAYIQEMSGVSWSTTYLSTCTIIHHSSTYPLTYTAYILTNFCLYVYHIPIVNHASSSTFLSSHTEVYHRELWVRHRYMKSHPEAKNLLAHWSIQKK